MWLNQIAHKSGGFSSPVVSVPRSLVHLEDWKMNEGAILERSGPAIQRSGRVHRAISKLKRSGSKGAR